MGTKLGKVVTYHERLPLFKSHDPLIAWPMWSHVTDWNILHFHKVYDQLTWHKIYDH